ncbi:universal stress protein [Solibacillus daqui]|uniref:universal stress protein n=1 Tax=Solibacillus daqui TaxID=2912187 RepID=UPI0023671C38|nr:universal stress protein [Solibacillus daqui]
MSLTYKNILVAVDESNESKLAFKRAIQVALYNFNSKLYVVHVIDTRSFAFYESYNLNMVDRAYDLATELLNSHIAMAKEAGLENVEMIIEYGAPRQIIARDIPKAKQIHLIICGVTGKGEVERILMGSVSESIVHMAKCDVLVVRNL